MGDRLPDFLIIGAIKCGTTTLFQWLAQHPGVSVAIKEPHFFGNDANWDRGLSWYTSQLPDISDGRLTGEASASYTAYHRAEVAAGRIAQVVPQVKLIYLIREPVERMRSHYRHAVLRGHETRLFEDAVRDPAVRYVTSSLYHTCLAPYLDRFDRDQVLVARMNDLSGDGHPAWAAVLDHLAVERTPAPGSVHNQTKGKRSARPIARTLVDRSANVPTWVPAWARRAGRGVLMRRMDDDPRLRSADGPVPDDVTKRLYADSERLAQALDRPGFWLDTERP